MKKSTRLLHVFVVFLLVAFAWPVTPSSAQSLPPRFGLGFEVLGSTADGLGIGLQGRASAPINADLSLGVDMGATGFVLGGRRDATWVFDPQVSAIITLPSRSGRAMYYLAGLGAYIPISDDEDNEAKAGPTVHGGVGWIQTLRETTFFYEINPALVIAQDQVHLAVPLRVGIIF